MSRVSGMLLPVLLLVLCAEVFGCTSFVNYLSESPLYGMNFDWYPDAEISFDLSPGDNGSTVFTMSFSRGGEDPVPTVGMNSFGVFSTMQVIDETVIVDPDEGEAMIWMPFYYGLWEAPGFHEIMEYVKFTRLVQYEDIPLHLMTAGPEGHAVIIEVGESENRLLEIGDSGFMVMTNFNRTAFPDMSPEEATGCGADRYRAAFGVLSENASGLDPMGAMGVLEAALNRYADSPTRASMVFDPAAGEVYIALDGDMETVWKVGLLTSLVEGVRGLPSGLSYSLPEDGITSEELRLRVEG